jgi:hypothetical protein
VNTAVMGDFSRIVGEGADKIEKSKISVWLKKKRLSECDWLTLEGSMAWKSITSNESIQEQ